MRTIPLLAAALVAAGTLSSAHAQVPLPGDWDQKVSAVVPEPERAKKVVDAGRQYDARAQASREAMKAADAEMKAVFLGQGSSEGDRRLSLNVFRDERRKAALAAVDALFRVKVLVSKKEWNGLWPAGYFAPPGPRPLLAVKVQEALPSVVADPARLRQAQEVTASLVKAASTDESSRNKATSTFAGLLERYETGRDKFIDLVNKLESTQEKADAALIDGGGRLKAILTPDEWDALVRRITAP